MDNKVPKPSTCALGFRWTRSTLLAGSPERAVPLAAIVQLPACQADVAVGRL
jgi:hypothetical protein